MSFRISDSDPVRRAPLRDASGRYRAAACFAGAWVAGDWGQSPRPGQWSRRLLHSRSKLKFVVSLICSGSRAGCDLANAGETPATTAKESAIRIVLGGKWGSVRAQTLIQFSKRSLSRRSGIECREFEGKRLRRLQNRESMESRIDRKKIDNCRREVICRRWGDRAQILAALGSARLR